LQEKNLEKIKFYSNLEKNSNQNNDDKINFNSPISPRQYQKNLKF
jgi:hypothetical protein